MRYFIVFCSIFSSIFLLNNVLAQNYLTKGLLAYYPLNGNAKDGREQRNDGYILRAKPTKNRFNVPGSALHVDGGGVEIYNVNIPQQANTITVWVKPDKFPNYGKRNILSKHFSYSNCELLIRIRPDGFYSVEWNVGSTFFDLGKEDSAKLVEPTYTDYDFLVLRYDGAEVEFFVNNKLSSHKYVRGNVLNNKLPLTIGSLAGFPKKEAFYGDVDELRVYNRALSNSELSQLFQFKE